MSRYSLRRVGEKDLEAIQTLFEASPDYFIKVEGHEAKKDAAAIALIEVPPNFSLEKKYCYGFYEDEKLMGFIDILNGYPDSSIAYLGFLIIPLSAYGRGLGRKAFELLEKEVRMWGVSTIRLSVALSNDVAGFWEKMGFVRTGRILMTQTGVKCKVLEMDKKLS